MKVGEAIKRRRSIRSFKGKKVFESDVKRLVEAANWAPSASNNYAWKVMVVQNDREIEKISALSPGIFSKPAIILILLNELEGEERGEGGILGLMDIAIAAQNICLMGIELGLGTCIVRSFSRKGVRRLMDIPENLSPELIVTVGYPADPPYPA